MVKNQRKDPLKQRNHALNCCGYGAPSLERALLSAGDSLTLILQDGVQPFCKTRGGVKTRDMHLLALPWPNDALLELGELNVSLRVTLSYFIEPNPGARGTGSKYSDQSHALRFEDADPVNQQRTSFRESVALREMKKKGTNTAAPHPDRTVGDQLRRRGSLHSDVWNGSAAELADRGFVAVTLPQGGGVAAQSCSASIDRPRYALIISIEAPESPVDLYALVAAEIGMEIQT